MKAIKIVKISSLKMRISSIILIISLLIGAFFCLICYYVSNEIMEETYEDVGTAFLRVMVKTFNADTLEKYIKNPVEDLRYKKQKKDTIEMKEKLPTAAYMYIFYPYENGAMYLLDIDTDKDKDKDANNRRYELGEYVSYDKAFIPYIDEMLNNEELPVFLTNYNNKELLTILQPIKDSKGDFVGYGGIDIEITEITILQNVFVTAIGIASLIFSLIMALCGADIFFSKVVKPIDMLSAHAMHFAKRSLKNKNDEDQEPFPIIKTGDEIQALAEAIEKMEHDTFDYIDNLKVFTANQERIDAELSIAAKIQHNALPNVFSLCSEIELYATMKSAKEVGGDFYDFFYIDKNHLAFTIADVSGKGIGASLFMMIGKAYIKTIAQLGKTPKEVLFEANNQLCTNNNEKMFITAWFGILELSTKTLCYANAGHNQPLIKRENGKFEYFNTDTDFVLGGIAETVYHDETIKLNCGDTIYLYTDGVTEANNINNEFYGEARLQNLLNNNLYSSPQVLLENAEKELNEFQKGTVQFDDITMLCVTIKELYKEKRQIRCKADTAFLNEMTTTIKEMLKNCSCSNAEKMKIELAAEEWFVNVASYAYDDNNGFIDITIETSSNEIIMKFQDNGVSYNPVEKDPPNLDTEFNKRKIGGLGIFLIKEVMDHVEYIRKDNKNLFIISKKW